MDFECRYLIKRYSYWYYYRRVPKVYAQLDSRTFIRKSLKTRSLAIACERRDALEAADNRLWAAKVALRGDEIAFPHKTKLLAQIDKRYAVEQLKALTHGLSASATETVLRDLALGELLDRIQSGPGRQPHTSSFSSMAHTSNDVLRVTVSDAFEIYRERIAIDEQINKSPSQKRDWLRALKTSIRRFVDVVGDIKIGDISRDHALTFYTWWSDRLRPRPDKMQKKPNTANRDFGTLRKLYSKYFEFYGHDDRPNPFKKLFFKMGKGEGPVPYLDKFVQNRVLAPGALDALMDDARLLLFVLIETGCRSSEVANLRAQDIILDTDIPYIRIQARPGRELKAPASMREIPLVGIALEALQRRPKGFSRYRNRENYLSSYLNRKLDEAELRPTQRHSVYSFRHAFERRMLEAEIDFELRCRLMGHKIGRPLYGGGGSMAFRRDQLFKIVHPYSKSLFAEINS